MELAGLTGSKMPFQQPARSVFFQWPFLALFVVTLSSSVSVYEFYFYPRYLRGQGMRETAIGIAMGAFYFGSLVGMPLAAEAIRRHGSRFVIASGVIGIAVTSMLLSTSSSLSLVVPFRVVHGVLWSFVLIPGSNSGNPACAIGPDEPEHRASWFVFLDRPSVGSVARGAAA